MLCAACRLARQQRVVGAGARAGARRSLAHWAARPALAARPPTQTQTLTPTPSPTPSPTPTRTRTRFFSSAAAAPPASDAPAPAAAATPAAPPKPDFLDAAESVIWDRLAAAFAPVTALSVRDISGGCGSMYGIEISAEAFRGRGMLQQQRMVNSALGDLMKGWHGVQLKTRAPE